MIQAPPRTILQVFESLPEGTLAQVINNRLLMSPAPNSAHQRISREIFSQLNHFVQSNKLGEAFYAPVDVYFDEGNIYEPDIFFISKERTSIIRNNVYGAPDLIIEILSLGSERVDKIEKKEVYERCGVKEYWIVQPLIKKVIGYKASVNGFIEIPSKDGVLISALLQLTIQF